MKRQLSFPIHPLLAAVIVVGAFFAVLFTIYGINRWVSSGEVIGNVQIAEADVGGKTEDQALNTVEALEIGRLTRLATFVVDGETVQLEPGYTGLDVDQDEAVAEAMAVGRTGNVASQFLHWLTHIFATTRIELDGSLDEMAMNDIFDGWNTEVIAKPISPGAVELIEGELVATYPATGVGIDRAPAQRIVLDT